MFVTGIICLTLKYTVNTVLMNSEGASASCARAYSWAASWLQKQAIAESKRADLSRPHICEWEAMNNWQWDNKNDPFWGGSSGKSKMSRLYLWKTNLNYFCICMNYMNTSFETLLGGNHINSPNCQNAICVSLSSSLHPEDYGCLWAWRERLPPLKSSVFPRRLWEAIAFT